MSQNVQNNANARMVILLLYDILKLMFLFLGVVDCRNLGLTRIPEDIPFDTVEL